ncbi:MULTISPECIES: N-acetylmuramic acid 6-phosphate etherase [Kosmotoga]|uniref:N-acetylmuramic acid 6-phosphate etherase n=1 Tax=Kosmotoga olearia (strain ATCC BAA-1733 / DSM 21960 / TBF 19.5.1) TaxID=521045 RepID=C5CGK5_KOSOT|nr:MULTISPECIES: N-acetylmuramic acid 6-phosphate etherase [Kosmotoga]ACR79587.1 glucokinase regulatory-like protein [Kosmotoga olearia TBF 19.5.1]MDI3524437.1 N-acetylmuramic acid 6-phosphate etherase [Kosmotoga sp.]MDK2954250.1 N-acetylmuramic acid 6-phosphate etherase [Kosmotoga sp.]
MIEKLETEQSNPKSYNIDSLSTIEMLRLINHEDATVPLAVAEQLEKIATVIDMTVSSIRSGGRVIYCGAGTSGRLAVIDAAEVVPTFGVNEGLFLPLMAGGEEAFFKAVESVEDDEIGGVNDLISIGVKKEDTVIGLTASGRTPYVKGILKKAKEVGCRTVLIANVENPEIAQWADVVIKLRTGPEVITGSTRLKAGTSQKMVLNMISTVTMIKLGKVYKNYMVDVQILNTKLEERATKIISEVTGISKDEAKKFLKLSGNKTKLAILMVLSGKTKEECNNVLERTEFLSEALKMLSNGNNAD